MNFENALRGMRNPKNSWKKSDSKFGLCTYLEHEEVMADIVSNYCEKNNIDINNYELFDDICNKVSIDTILYENNGCVEYAIIGPKDMELAQILIKAGPEHRKFLRQIFVSVDITAPLYW